MTYNPAQKRAYYRANRERIKAAAKEWALNNPDKLKAKHDRWTKKRRAKRFVQMTMEDVT